MALKGVVDSLDDVEEALHHLYSQGTDGKYRLEVDGLVDKRRIDEFRTNNISLQKQLEKYSGVDLEEIEQLKARLADIDKQKAKDAGDWDAREKAIRAEMAEAFARERKPIDEERDTLRAALDEEVRIARATQAIAEAKGSPKVLLPHVLQHTKTVRGDDGRYTAVVVDELGNPRVGDSQGSNMSISQYVESLKQDPDFARNFEGTGSSGGGASKSVSGGDRSVKTIAADDSTGFMQNLESIASGETAVVP